MLYKLYNHVGIQGNMFLLINNYFKHRFSRIRINKSYSFNFEEDIGVPQGSVLGPIFFLIFINDLLNEIKCQKSWFADDLLIFDLSNDRTAQTWMINLNLKIIYKWVYKWRVVFDSAKFKLINFTRDKKKCNKNPCVDINDNWCERVLQKRWRLSHEELSYIIQNQRQLLHVCERTMKRTVVKQMKYTNPTFMFKANSFIQNVGCTTRDTVISSDQQNIKTTNPKKTKQCEIDILNTSNSPTYDDIEEEMSQLPIVQNSNTIVRLIQSSKLELCVKRQQIPTHVVVNRELSHENRPSSNISYVDLSNLNHVTLNFCNENFIQYDERILD